jgi:hypothetical protein
MHTTKELLLETIFPTRYVQSGYKKENWGDLVRTRVEAGSNTSTLGLRWKGDPVPGGITGSPCSWGTWPFRLGKSRIWDSKTWSWAPQDSDLRMTALARTSSNREATDPSYRQRGCYIRTITASVELENKITVSWVSRGLSPREADGR